MNEMLRIRIACINKPLLDLGMEVINPRSLLPGHPWYDFYNELIDINNILLQTTNFFVAWNIEIIDIGWEDMDKDMLFDMLYKRWMELVLCMINLRNDAMPPLTPVLLILVDMGKILFGTYEHA